MAARQQKYKFNGKQSRIVVCKLFESFRSIIPCDIHV